MERGSKPAKVKTDARPPVARKSRKTDRSTGRQLEQRLAAALEQQTATSEILRVISNSPTDLQPVFDAIVRSASRLCGGQHAIVVRVDGESMCLAASYNERPGTALEAVFPRRLGREIGIGRAILDAAPVHIPDVEEDREYSHEVMRALGLRSSLSVPLLREGRPIGGIGVSRADPWPFAENRIELMKTFAEQAVIAIENVRLFKALDARTAQLTKSVRELRALLIRLGYRSLLAVPQLREDHLLGGLVVYRNTAGAFAPQAIELLQTFATQSALAIQNARLFRQIEEKSRELEAGSRHKSEFL